MSFTKRFPSARRMASKDSHKSLGTLAVVSVAVSAVAVSVVAVAVAVAGGSLIWVLRMKLKVNQSNFSLRVPKHPYAWVK